MVQCLPRDHVRVSARLSHAKQLLEGMQQNKHQNKSQSEFWRYWACILTRMLNSSIHRLFIFRINSSCELKHTQCNLSKCTPKVASLLYSQKWTTQRNKILDLKWGRLGPCASWFTKGQEGRKLHWVSTRPILYDSIYGNQLLMTC